MAMTETASYILSSKGIITAPTTIARFSQELIDLVIDGLHGDLPSLFSTSLVCRDWHISAMRHIFCAITIPVSDGQETVLSIDEIGEDAFRAFEKRRLHRVHAITSVVSLHEILSRSPRLIHYIRRVELRGDATGRRNPLPDENIELVWELLATTMAGLTHLESVELSDHVSTMATSPPWDLIDVLLKRSSLRRVSLLHVTVVDLASTFSRLLSHGLHEFSMVRVTHQPPAVEQHAAAVVPTRLVFRVNTLTIEPPHSRNGDPNSHALSIAGLMECATFTHVKKLAIVSSESALSLCKLLKLSSSIQELGLTCSLLGRATNWFINPWSIAKALGDLNQLKTLTLHSMDSNGLSHSLKNILSQIRPTQPLENLCIGVVVLPPPYYKWYLVDRVLTASHLASIRKVTFKMRESRWNTVPDIFRKLPMLRTAGMLEVQAEE